MDGGPVDLPDLTFPPGNDHAAVWAGISVAGGWLAANRERTPVCLWRITGSVAGGRGRQSYLAPQHRHSRLGQVGKPRTTAAPANTAPTSEQASEVPAGGGVKADNYEDAPAANATGSATMPSDQREYVSARESLWAKQRVAVEGTRTYAEVGQQFDDLNASMDGKEVRDWLCIIPNGEGGKVRDNMRTLSCTADGDNKSRYNLFFDDPTVLQEVTYPGDVLTVSGVIENKSGGWIRIHPSAATIVEKSK